VVDHSDLYPSDEGSNLPLAPFTKQLLSPAGIVKIDNNYYLMGRFINKLKELLFEKIVRAMMQ
jgi:hypothetical protein